MKNILTAFLLILYSAVSAQDMKGMKIYTCTMHPEIQSSKPGNCPKCGMKLVVQKAKTVKPKASAPDKKAQPAKTSDMGDMKMPMKEEAKKTDNMENMGGMEMGDNSSAMDNIKKAKVNLGAIKTITNNQAPRTVRYDLYIADTTVTFGRKQNGQLL